MQRLFIPLALLAVALGAWFGADYLGEAEVSSPVSEPLIQSETAVLSARRMPEFLVAPIAASALSNSLEVVTNAAFGSSCLVVTNGSEVVFDHQADVSLTPASVQKLLTAYSALQSLGPNYRFTTQVVAQSKQDENGVLQGNVYLVGGGDPLLMTLDYAQTLPYPPQIRTPIEDLADNLVRSGVSAINGGVYAVEIRYDDERYPKGWPERYATQGQAGPLSALMINDGFTQYPSTPGGWRFGEQPVAADDPALHAARLFDDLLEAQQVTISASSRNVSRSDFEGAGADIVLATIESPPMSEIVRQMLVQSDNTTAELLVKAIGFEESSAGTTDVGARAMRSLLRDGGLPDLIVPPADGSGLDPSNKLSCDYVAQLLRSARPDTPFGDALPVAGQDGTLSDRFVGNPAAGRLHGKTGTLNDVTALAGYVETEKGEILQFAYLVNLIGNATVTDDLVDLQEVLGAALVSYPAGPSVAEVAPIGSSELAAEALGLDTDQITEDVEIEPAPTVDPNSVPSEGQDPQNDALEELREALEQSDG